MAETITFSIIIPTYNRVAFLREAIISAANAAPKSSEIIVVNDGDPLLIHDLPAVNVPLHLVTNKDPTGASGARNYGVSIAQGDWLFFLDDDDRILPGYWAHVADSVLHDITPDILAYGFCAVSSFTDRAATVPAFQQSEIQKINSPIGPAYLAGLGKGFWVSRKAYIATGGLNPALKVNEDTDFCIALLKRSADCYHCATAGVQIFTGTVSGSQPSVTLSVNAAARHTYFSQIIDDHAAYLATTPKLSAWLHGRAFQYAARMLPRKWPNFGPAAATLSTGTRCKLILRFAIHAILSPMRAKRDK